MVYLERRFKRGMDWSNYGIYWHVGHIRPAASFHLTIEGQAEKCWHYSNLIPQAATENLAAGAKLEWHSLQAEIT